MIYNLNTMETIPTACAICQSPMRYVAAGVSKKTNRPYDAFYSCENRECNYTWKEGGQSKKVKSAVSEYDQGQQILTAIANLRTYEREVAITLEGQIKTAKKEIIEAIEKDKVIYPD